MPRRRKAATEAGDSNMVDGGTAPVQGLARSEKALLKESGASNTSSTEEVVATPPSLGMKVLGTVLSAFLFGWALNKGGVYRADVIQDQFLFANNTMLLMFLSATASSIFVIAALKSSSYAAAVTKSGQKYLEDATISLFSVTLGGLLIGIGMRVSGTCPGTIFAQLGSGAVKTWVTFAGAIVGAVLHGFLRGPMMPWLKWGAVVQRPAYRALGVNQWLTAAGFIALIGGLLALVTSLWWTPLPGTAVGFEFTAAYWHPILAGCFIGALQLPLTLMVQKNLGASTTLSVAAAWATAWTDASPYLAKLRGDPGKLLDVLFATVCILGSAAASGSTTPNPNWTTAADMAGVSWGEAVLGGLILGAGARLANGCTSGHGITGAGHQSLVSFVGVAAIFAGGIATALVYAGVQGEL